MDREAVNGAQVLRGQLVGRPELDLHLHVRQVDSGGQRARAVVALFGLLDEGVWWTNSRGETVKCPLIITNKTEN